MFYVYVSTECSEYSFCVYVYYTPTLFHSRFVFFQQFFYLLFNTPYKRILRTVDVSVFLLIRCHCLMRKYKWDWISCFVRVFSFLLPRSPSPLCFSSSFFWLCNVILTISNAFYCGYMCSIIRFLHTQYLYLYPASAQWNLLYSYGFAHFSPNVL